jgi:hypothetical protein
MTKRHGSVHCDARVEDGSECLAGIDAGCPGALAALMKGRWTTVGRRDYFPAHKQEAEERAEFECRADATLDPLMARLRKSSASNSKVS